MIGADQPLTRTLFPLANYRIAGVDADIAQRMQAAALITCYEHRARRGVAAKIADILAEAGFVVDSYPWLSKDPLALGGEHVLAVEKGRIGRNFARFGQLPFEGDDAGREFHRLGSLIVC